MQTDPNTEIDTGAPIRGTTDTMEFIHYADLKLKKNTRETYKTLKKHIEKER